MLRVIVDTNVLVSSLIQRSYPFLIIDYIFSKNTVELCISNDVVNEYLDVLSRIKFFKYPDYEVKSKILLYHIKKIGFLHFPTVKVNIIKDEPDNRFLELAETCNADYIITGNTKHFPMKEYKSTRIVSPHEFWEIEVL
jgi:hypothetical protein